MSCSHRIQQFPRKFLCWQARGCIQIYSFKSMVRTIVRKKLIRTKFYRKKSPWLRMLSANAFQNKIHQELMLNRNIFRTKTFRTKIVQNKKSLEQQLFVTISRQKNCCLEQESQKSSRQTNFRSNWIKNKCCLFYLQKECSLEQNPFRTNPDGTKLT